MVNNAGLLRSETLSCCHNLACSFLRSHTKHFTLPELVDEEEAGTRKEGTEILKKLLGTKNDYREKQHSGLFLSLAVLKRRQ